jgi:hypothetical protein
MRKLSEILKHWLFNILNLPKHICDNLLNDKAHTHVHRMFVGLIIMPIGVFISKCFTDVYIAHFMCDVIGYAIHGMGLMPFLEIIAKTVND